MNRRDLLKAACGFALSPLIRLDLSHERDLSTLVMQFVDRHQYYLRYDLDAPFACHEQSVATDGHAMIAVPGLRYVESGKELCLPDVDAVFHSYWPTIEETSWRKWLPLPQVHRRVPDAHDHCPVCNDTPCPICDGEGEAFSESYGWTRTCTACNGHGYIPNPNCSVCHGTLKNVAWCEDWGDQMISAKYASLIRQIPGVRWMRGRDSKGPIILRGDGGIRCFVMPVARR